MSFGPRRTWFESQLLQLLALQPWENDLNLGFLLREMEKIPNL